MTWNLGRRSHAEHVSVLGAAHADIVALQEVAAQHQAMLARGLAAQGLVHLHGGPNAPRSFAFTSLIVSRSPLRAANTDGPDVPFPERVQVAIVATPFGDVEVLNVHVPAATSSGVAVKVATFEGLARYLACPTLIPRIVCGDFNTPKSEAPGRVEYWGSSHQQRAERAVIEGEATTGLRDAFRHVNGPSANAASWRAPNGVARRYDHVFASPELLPIEAAYGDLDEIKAAKMSDHAPLRVVFQPTLEATEAIQFKEALPSPVVAVPRTAPVPSASVHAPKEEDMTTPGNADLRAFLKGLTYRTDVRKDPDNRRRGQFRGGWNRATEGGAVSEEKLRAELSWHNLGFRAGQAFGSATATSIDDAFDRFAAIYVQERG
jgi:exonuclease III